MGRPVEREDATVVTDRDGHPHVAVPTDNARSAYETGRIRYILLISTVLAVILLSLAVVGFSVWA